MKNNLFYFESFEESVSGTILFKDCTFGERHFPFVEMDFHTNYMNLLNEEYEITGRLSMEFRISDIVFEAK